MAAAKVQISLKYTVFRGLKFIPRARYSFNLVSPRINPSQSFKNSRFISASSYLAKDRVDSDYRSGSRDAENEKQNKNEERSDLKRLKELLFQGNSKAKESDETIHNVVQLVKPQSKQTKLKAKAGATVNVTQITDMLSILNPSKDQSPDGQSKSPTRIEERDTQIDRSVEADKLRDALSTLEQDSSTADEVIMAGRQITSDSWSAIEGAYNIKQQQFRDKDKRKKMPLSSLKTGPRFHMFDKVQEKWSHEHGDIGKTIFQEMAEQEVKDLGMLASVQSGFHDLMDNVHRQWSFPVDNEVSKAEEGVGFDEHVFLEHLLNDFPNTGNIRQFMELVVTGLQQNPYLNVQDKKEHIEWFREYFQNIPDEQVQL
ncbi:28S ribosomal S31, mitochondrial-like [Paramuricea clavata]|uniref:Small ribosomal subunit protein mS31 n=1 Tax=Paramuricea clavata TaxID=317549 RepID=A0A7D9DGA3_PARCT|nr:28S ribosomal S31, mitochondrial-like [Paramuricea clavata]